MSRCTAAMLMDGVWLCGAATAWSAEDRDVGPDITATELDRFDDYPLLPRANFDNIPFNRINTEDSAAYFLLRHRRGGEEGVASHPWLHPRRRRQLARQRRL